MSSYALRKRKAQSYVEDPIEAPADSNEEDTFVATSSDLSDGEDDNAPPPIPKQFVQTSSPEPSSSEGAGVFIDKYTPQRSKARGEPRDQSAALKTNVNDASPLGDCDALTGEINLDGVHEYCHLISHATEGYLIFRFCIKGKVYYFNVDTRFNIFVLEPGEHKKFDKKLWALCPTLDVLKIILAWNKDPKNAKSYLQLLANRSRKNGDDLWSYHYIRFNRLTPIVKREVENTEGDPTKPPVWKVISECKIEQSAADLIIKSHVHPFCVLFNLGQKLNHWDKVVGDVPGPEEDVPEQIDLLNRVRQITEGWFDPRTKEEAEGLDGLYDRPPTVLASRTRSEAASSMGVGQMTLQVFTADDPRSEKRTRVEDSDDDLDEAETKKLKLA